ncbi:hypothetical protein KAU33_08360 [Candidatus Dependentiae bacterium]|nr:hypothetical protein [Candidatus Dependentiae bacterium]
MENFNDKIYEWLFKAFDLVELMGLPISILAWLSISVGSILMIFVLRKYSLKGKWVSPLILGIVSLITHLSDYWITLSISPDLQYEMNPIWIIIINNFGLKIALWYGFTGKIFLSILAFEFYAFYKVSITNLFPEKSGSFKYFLKNFGKSTKKKLINLPFIYNFFSFMFAFLNPFYLYIVFMNAISDKELYSKMPAIPIVILIYLGVCVILYFKISFTKFCKMKKKKE